MEKNNKDELVFITNLEDFKKHSNIKKTLILPQEIRDEVQDYLLNLSLKDDVTSCYLTDGIQINNSTYVYADSPSKFMAISDSPDTDTPMIFLGEDKIKELRVGYRNHSISEEASPFEIYSENNETVLHQDKEYLMGAAYIDGSQAAHEILMESEDYVYFDLIKLREFSNNIEESYRTLYESLLDRVTEMTDA